MYALIRCASSGVAADPREFRPIRIRFALCRSEDACPFGVFR